MALNDVVIDVDGVLADFEWAFCEKFGRENREKYSLEERYPTEEYRIQLFSASPKTYENLLTLRTGVQIVKFLENKGFEIHIVSSRPYDVERITGVWLKQNKIPFHYMSVCNGDKMGMIDQIAPLLIVDDSLQVCKDAAGRNTLAFLIDQPWNYSKELPRFVHRIGRFDGFSTEFSKILKGFLGFEFSPK